MRTLCARFKLPNGLSAILRPLVLFAGCLAALILFLNARMQSETAETILSKYGWTIKEKLAEHNLMLPVSFEHQPGDFPISIYWACNNEFGKEIGLDLKPCLGRRVTVSLYVLKESLPESLRRNEYARAVIVARDRALVGAWIDNGYGFLDFARSLSRRSFEDITQRTWGDWLVSSGVVNPKNEVDKKLARMSPEEIIAFYYDAVDRQDYRSAYGALSRRNIIDYLFSNRSKTELFSRGYSETYANSDVGLENIKSAKLLSVKPYLRPSEAEYEVFVEMKFKKAPETLDGDGKYGWYVILTKEIDSLGWRIDAIGSGP
jgi:hypothetical protein